MHIVIPEDGSSRLEESHTKFNQGWLLFEYKSRTKTQPRGSCLDLPLIGPRRYLRSPKEQDFVSMIRRLLDPRSATFFTPTAFFRGPVALGHAPPVRRPRLSN
ncbi:hypothetical protein EVAR_8150_1 [Eumeta japonica]|uniref:Uncharacterized protein n=1 Tax=Eumeta variegata TaxID=151549 RepID=A0A4C1TSW4_EUMVA|nr:hypothetical protein EVAR_8150_1 [Eumeta japonica]